MVMVQMMERSQKDGGKREEGGGRRKVVFGGTCNLSLWIGVMPCGTCQIPFKTKLLIIPN